MKGNTYLDNHKLRLHDVIYQLRFYSNSLIHILSLSNSHNNVASVQKNGGDKSHRVILALLRLHLHDTRSVWNWYEIGADKLCV